jgi:hypothetical protein
MGGWTEDVLIPAVDEEALRTAVSTAVQKGLIWLVNGTVSLLEEEVPSGFLNEHAQLLPPPASIPAAHLVPDQLPAAWSGEEATADHIRGALSANLGKPLPWATVRKSLEEGFSLGLFERTLDSGPWPCDLGGAPAVRLRVVLGVKDIPIPRVQGTAKTAKAVLETHEIVDLADTVDKLLEATAGHELRLTMIVDLDREGGASENAIAGVNEVLGKVKDGWMLQ